ncbi:hypothetical protein OS493_024833 [Desmophyllum pertusum]|uniref:Uncharacterized protein n=1 Tax=Desmophyllum pertusum TaxID=174260 RepID=A0A9W9ZAK1_9CNID|nr:hypothetical protein OS493_024833 [Desmophyllum pertusum]
MKPNLVGGHTTKEEMKRIEKKGERGVCRIQKRCTGGQGYQTVGSGSLIKHQIDPQWKSKYLIVTTNEVFQGDFDVRKYRVDFVKSRSKMKTLELGRVVIGGDIFQTASGLAVAPLDSHSSVFRHGCFRKKCGILKHRPFEVPSFNDGDVDNAFSNGSCCHMVAEDTSSNLFGVKPHDLTRDASSGQYAVSNFTPSTRVALGAAILRRDGNNWSAVGVLSSSTTDTFRPVWLSRENFSNLRTGEAITAIEGDPVVYVEQSSTEQTPGRDKMNNNQHSRIQEEQRESERIDGGTPNGGRRSEEINNKGR